MLKFFRKHARGWFMTAVIAIIIVVFVLFFGGGGGGQQASTIATIDKRILTENEFHNEYERLAEMARLNFGDKLTPEMLKQMDLKA
ncbi:MAG: SurA N-terminal domain-containing protein, partial [Smithella sp.]|nr:SurA N-terminal domain-containing protein [Smithella sp.]